MRKLTGHGGITSRVEKFKRMGVATQKQLPQSALLDHDPEQPL